MVNHIRLRTHLSPLMQTYPLSCSFSLFPLDMCCHIIIGVSRASRLSCRQWSSHNIWTFPFSCRLTLFRAEFPAFLQTPRLYCRSFLFPADLTSILQKFPFSCRLNAYTAEVSVFLQTFSLSCRLPIYNAEVSSFLPT